MAFETIPEAATANQLPFSGNPAPERVPGVSYFMVQACEDDAVNGVTPGSLSQFIPYYVPEDGNYDAFSYLISSGTNDAAFALYEWDTSGLKLGAQIATGTTGASPTLNAFTNLTFAGGVTAVTEGWKFLGHSGVGNNGNVLYAMKGSATSTDVATGFANFAVNATKSGTTSFFSGLSPFYEAAARIAAISPGDALTSDINATFGGVPLIGLRRAV